MAKKKIEPTKNTKEEIEAAVNAYYAKTSSSSSTNDPMPNIPTIPGTPEEVEKKFDEIDEVEKREAYGEALDEQKACGETTLEITASDCKKFSLKHPDHTIDEYIMGINKKIFNEANNGGFSTNVTFKVIPSDWINVSHILDWYRVHGFEVINEETNSPQYGKDAGAIIYNFTISWVNAQVQ